MKSRKISRGPPELINIIHNVAELKEVTDVDYTIHFGCDDIDFYIDGIYKVHIRGYRDGQKVMKKYIIKWHSETKRRTLFREAYKREILFYGTIVPKLLWVQRSCKVIEGLKMKFPNCDFYNSEWNKESIVISDPQYEGFRFYERLRRLNLEHVSIVLKNLAKMHALSFALAKSRPDDFRNIIQSNCIDVQYDYNIRVPQVMASYYKDSLKVIRDASIKKKLSLLAPDILLILNKCTVPNFCRFRTICHGDCWNNNVLFKYQKPTPVDVMFIDYQQIRYASPVTDISFYLYMSTDQQFLSTHYDRVISLYYSTLSAVLRQCDMDPNEIYPQSIFYEHLKEYSVFGLIESLISMKIITAVPEEAMKMTVEALSEDVSYVNESGKCLLYEERVNGVVEHFFARNYLLDAVLNK